jgi:hypothetical protein
MNGAEASRHDLAKQRIRRLTLSQRALLDRVCAGVYRRADPRTTAALVALGLVVVHEHVLSASASVPATIGRLKVPTHVHVAWSEVCAEEFATAMQRTARKRCHICGSYLGEGGCSVCTYARAVRQRGARR